MFNAKELATKHNVNVHLVQIEFLSEEIKQYLDKQLLGICRGDFHINELKYIKLQLKNFFKGKDPNKIYGSIAELFAHLYFKSLDFSNKFMFLNMEENSLKKGFDGFYQQNDKIWLLDSKSGKFDSKAISHREKLLEANRSVKDQLLGNTKNNPWENAFQHANSRDVDSSTSLLKTIRNFSNRYMEKQFADLNTLNVILASTIYFYETWQEQEIESLIEHLKDIEGNFNYLNVILFCSNQKSYEEFLEYLEEEEIESRREESVN